ncbi:MAG: BamA/TamA family outer membrane protein [Rhizobacter sp.]
MSVLVRAARQLSGLTAAVLLSAAMLALSGCAAFQHDEPAPLTDAPAAAMAPAGPASAPNTGPVSYRFEIDAPPNLRKMLQTYLDLARFQTAPQTEGITDAELIRLTNASPSQARQLLETEGYFNPQVTAVRTDPPNETPLITLHVNPGPHARVVSWELQASGELQQRAEAGASDATALIARLSSQWDLKRDDLFSQSAWSSAKNTTLAQLRAEGYPTANWGETEARVDAHTNEVVLALTYDSGPLFLMGELKIEGVERYKEQAIRNVADFAPGTPYSEKRLLDFQERLGKLNLFESITVEIDPDIEKAKSTPVTVKVKELLRQQAVAGVGFSDNTRERFTLEHQHRHPFGLPLQVHNKLELGRYLRTWDGDLLGDPGAGQYRPLLAGGSSWLRTPDDITTSWHARLGRSLVTERIERLIYGEYLSATVRNATGNHTSHALSANYNWLWRELDSMILPTRGLTSVIQAAAGYSTSNDKDNGPFSRLYTRNTLYWRVPRSQWYWQARAEFGEVFAKENVGIPDTLLFRAGGDDSVRGYGYKELGPRTDGVLTSGRKLATASIELAHPISQSQPSIWWATFLDAGSAADQWSEFTPSLGYGVGVRWRSPVGPLRIDWAYGRDVHKSRLHFSVGIAF